MIDGLSNNKVYIVKVCAETESVSASGSTHVGEASQSEEVWLPADSCGSYILPPMDGAELSAGMIGGAVCAILFLLLAIIGFVVWR